MTKRIIYIVCMVFLVLGCSSKKQVPDIVYLMNNDVNSLIDINGPLKSYVQFTYNNRDSVRFNSLQKFKNRICCDLGNITKFRQYDSLGDRIKSAVNSYLDSLKQDYFKPLPNTVMGAGFYQSISLPEELQGYHFKTSYHKDIIQPIPIRRNTIQYSKMGENNMLESNNIANDTTGGDFYFYEFDEQMRIKQRRTNTPFYSSMDKRLVFMHYYSESVEYTYDKNNQIIKETHVLYKDVEEDFPMQISKSDPRIPVFKESINIYGLIVTKDGELTVDYTYNDQGLVSKALLSVSGTLFTLEEYTYHDNKVLKERVVRQYHYNYSTRTRAFKSIFEYDKYGSVIHLQEYDQNNELSGEQWTDYYDRDEHDNWTRAEVYLSGKREGSPDVIIYRKNEYYD